MAAGRRERFGGRDGTELSRVDIPDEPADRGKAPQVRVKEGQVADLPALELVKSVWQWPINLKIDYSLVVLWSA